MTLTITLPPPPLQLREVVAQPDDCIAQQDQLKQIVGEVDHWLDVVEDGYNRLCRLADEGADPIEIGIIARSLWDMMCSWMADHQHHLAQSRQSPPGLIRREWIAADVRHVERLADLIRTMAIVWEDLDLTTPDNITDVVWTVQISPLAYLRATWNLLWSSLRHPFTETTVELRSGRILLTD